MQAHRVRVVLLVVVPGSRDGMGGWGRHWHGHGRRLGQVLGDGDPDLGDLSYGSRDLLLLVPPWAGEIGVVNHEYVALKPGKTIEKVMDLS